MKRYAGSMLGFLWVFLNPVLFLSVYVFLYLVVFRTSWPDTTAVGYTVFVFAGLVPFLAFMEVANGRGTSASSAVTCTSSRTSSFPPRSCRSAWP